MKNRDLYQTLGVKRNAEPETIKKAFRKKVMANHPDRGGEAAELALVKRAYDCLSDPAKKAHYDKTGEVVEKVIDNDQAKAVGVLCNAFLNVAMQVASQVNGPETEDMAKHMGTFLDKTLEAIAETLNKIRKDRAFFEKCKKRFKVKKDKSEVNFLERTIDQQLEMTANAQQQAEKSRDQNLAAKELLATLSFEHSQQLMAVFGGMTGTATGFGWTQFGGTGP